MNTNPTVNPGDQGHPGGQVTGADRLRRPADARLLGRPLGVCLVFKHCRAADVAGAQVS
jgi:hypothetical protein